MNSILVVEDDLDLADLLHYNISQAGFNCKVFNDGLNAWAWLQDNSPEAALLDIMLPGMDGLELCRKIKQSRPSTAIIMLTAKGEEMDRVVGLELGADDYVTKPFSMRELLLRIKAVLRRQQVSETEVIKAGCLHIAVATHQVLLDGRELSLTATEFELLRYLALRPGRVQNRDQLLQHVWGYNAGSYGRTVDTHMRRLRQKLEPYEQCLETVRAVGYRFNKEALER